MVGPEGNTARILFFILGIVFDNSTWAVESGIVILNQLIENDLTHLKIKKKRKMELADEARMILTV